MTLATATGGDPWAAPVYYVYHGQGFCFFSDPEARHIRESVDGGRAAAAVFASASTWQDIRGIQMAGGIAPLPANLEALGVIGAYVNKFPFTREFFSPGDLLDPAAFSRRFNVKLYRFDPTLVYYLDNSVKFGFRETVRL
jgi:hypothetical protein